MSTAYMIQPVEITPAMITDTNIPEPELPDYQEWSGVTLYPVGATVSIATLGRRYKCAVENTGDNPPDNLSNDGTGNQSWTDIGATNLNAPFDGIIGNQATGPSDAYWQVTTGSRYNSISIQNIDATEVTVTATTATGGTAYDYSETINTGGYRGGGWANFFRSGERRAVKNIELLGLPKFDDTVVTISFTGFVGVGLIVLGNQFIIGQTHTGIRPRIKSFSVKKFDTNFGYPILVPRLPAVRLSAVVQIDSSRQDIVFNTLKEFESKSAVWVFGVYSIATTYGWLDDYTPSLPAKGILNSPAQIKIKGFQ